MSPDERLQLAEDRLTRAKKAKDATESRLTDARAATEKATEELDAASAGLAHSEDDTAWTAAKAALDAAEARVGTYTTLLTAAEEAVHRADAAWSEALDVVRERDMHATLRELDQRCDELDAMKVALQAKEAELQRFFGERYVPKRPTWNRPMFAPLSHGPRHYFGNLLEFLQARARRVELGLLTPAREPAERDVSRPEQTGSDG